MRETLRAPIWLAVLVAACGGDPEPGVDFECRLGELRGAFRAHYVEQANGSCGPLADEIVILDPAGSPDCTVLAQDVSADRCSMSIHGRCATATGDTLDSTWAMRHVEPARIEGSVSLSLPGTCFSTYDVTMTRQ